MFGCFGAQPSWFGVAQPPWGPLVYQAPFESEYNTQLDSCQARTVAELEVIEHPLGHGDEFAPGRRDGDVTRAALKEGKPERALEPALVNMSAATRASRAGLCRP